MSDHIHSYLLLLFLRVGPLCCLAWCRNLCQQMQLSLVSISPEAPSLCASSALARPNRLSKHHDRARVTRFCCVNSSDSSKVTATKQQQQSRQRMGGSGQTKRLTQQTQARAATHGYLSRGGRSSRTGRWPGRSAAPSSRTCRTLLSSGAHTQCRSWRPNSCAGPS